MQVTLPTAMLRQIFRETFAHQNVASVAAIHHPTRDIDSYTGNVFTRISILNVLHWPAVDSHSYRQARLRAQRLAEFQSAFGRSFYRTSEDQGHAITSRQDDQLP